MNSEHRKKLKRYNLPNHARELTFSCYHKYNYFSDPIACDIFMDHLEDARKQMGFELWAYVIMPDHVHLLLWPEENADCIGKFLLKVKGLTARDYRRHIENHMPELWDAFCVDKQGKRQFKFWQSGGGYDRNMWDASPVHHAIRYIEGNPVRAGLVQSPEQWRWSSAWARHQRLGVIPDECNLPIRMGQ